MSTDHPYTATVGDTPYNMTVIPGWVRKMVKDERDAGRKKIEQVEGERDAARKEIQLLDDEVDRLKARNAHLEGLLAKEQL